MSEFETTLARSAGPAPLMQTTKVYLHLAGVVFRDEAEALERRLLGTTLYPSEVISPDLSAPEPA